MTTEKILIGLSLIPAFAGCVIGVRQFLKGGYTTASAKERRSYRFAVAGVLCWLAASGLGFASGVLGVGLIWLIFAAYTLQAVPARRTRIVELRERERRQAEREGVAAGQKALEDEQQRLRDLDELEQSLGLTPMPRLPEQQQRDQ